MCEHIARHLDETLDLDTLSRVGHLSRFHFHRLFAAGQLEQALTLADYPYWQHHYQRMLTQLQASKEGNAVKLSLRQ